MDIQALHQENNAYRDMIVSLKAKIREYDMRIRVNESEIGRQLEDMNGHTQQAIHEYKGCTLCMGSCDAEEC